MNEPWYRHPWPWLLAAGPAIVIVAGFATLWIAVETSDGLVADDYYKQGLAINKRLAREETARKLGLSATVQILPGRLHIDLSGQAPEALFVHLAHATRAGYDVRLRLAPVAPGRYEAELERLPAGHWRVVIEDPRGSWRISQEAS